MSKSDAGDEAAVRAAVTVLRRGGLVAFPTETVYGLGADATNAKAVAKIFAAKNRPATNPLIVHVADESTARHYAGEWPVEAEELAHAFWPGPLTLVLRKAAAVVDAVTAGGPTVGLRVPDHPLALALLRVFGGAVAAPSANRSNHVSPTTAGHVLDDLGGAVDCVLDGGPCRVGIESTVLDLSRATAGGRARILRPGGISRQQIEGVIGPVDGPEPSTPTTLIAASPGQLPVHYSPSVPAFRFAPEHRAEVEASWRESDHVALVTLGTPPQRGTAASASATLPADPAGYARQLYGTLRSLEAQGLSALWIEMPPDEGQWSAVRDRLARATLPLTTLPR